MDKKFLIASDLHGSMLALNNVLLLFEEERADNLILLGDIFGANSSEMVEKLNDISNRLTIVKGNNDWYFEPENAKFIILEQAYENLNGTLCYLCHGHKFNDMYPEMYGAKIVLQGHLHRPLIEKLHGVLRVCVGSISAPRSGSEKCYAVVEGHKISIKSINGELIDEEIF